MANFKPEKVYPAYAVFCDNPEDIDKPEKLRGFKPARVARWLAENEHFKTDQKTGILFYGNEEKEIIDRKIVEARPPRVEYSLTEKGRRVVETLRALNQVV